MVQKIPPPPFLTGAEYAGFNRWLLEITAILNDSGGIDPNAVAGLPEVIAQSQANADEIIVLQTTVGGNTGNISTLNSEVTTINGEITTINAEIVTINGTLTSLGARSQVLNGVIDPVAGQGNDGDWYANTSGAAGHRIFVKVAGAWAAFPF